MPNSAPVIANLNGDGVTFDAGGAPVRLDALANAAISDPDPFGFEVIRVGTGFSGGPLFMVEVPDGSGRMYVVEKSGTIRILDPATGTIAATPFLSVAGQVATTGEQGLLGFALAPDFADQRRLLHLHDQYERRQRGPPLLHPARQHEPGRCGDRRSHPPAPAPRRDQPQCRLDRLRAGQHALHPHRRRRGRSERPVAQQPARQGASDRSGLGCLSGRCRSRLCHSRRQSLCRRDRRASTRSGPPA